MIDTRQHRAEPLAIVHHAAHGNATEADTVIATLAADEARARALAVGAVIGERDLERRVHGFGARVAVEGVVEVARQQRGMARGQLERLGMAHLERGRVVHLVELLQDRGLDLLAAVARIDAPQARGAVDDLAALRRPVVNALGLGQHARVLLELPVRGERHEEGVEVVGDRLGGRRGHGKLPSRDAKTVVETYHLFTSTTTRPRISPLRIFGPRPTKSPNPAALTVESSLSSGRSVPRRFQASWRGPIGSITESMP